MTDPRAHLEAALGRPLADDDNARLHRIEPTTIEEKIAAGELTTTEHLLPGASWTHPALEAFEPDDWAHAFFHHYVGRTGLGVLTRSARLAGVSAGAIKERAQDDTLFRAALEAAHTELCEAFEYVLTDRNLNGTLKPVHQRGVLIGFVREIDNRLLQWTLERLMPEKYHLATRFELTAKDTPDAFTFAMGEVGDMDVLELEPGNEDPED